MTTDQETGALDRGAIGGAQLLDAEQRDDLLKLSIVGDRLADLLCGLMVSLTDEPWIQQAGGRGERVDGRIHAFARHVARQNDRGIEVAEDLGDGRIGEVVGRHIDRLDRGDGRAGDGRNALFELGDLIRQRRLIADARGKPSEQAGHLTAGLHEAVDIVDQQQHVFVRDPWVRRGH